MTTADWTAAELARLFRARDAYIAGYLDDWDDHRGEGTRHCCHLVAHARALPAASARTDAVLRALRGIGLVP